MKAENKMNECWYNYINMDVDKPIRDHFHDGLKTFSLKEKNIQTSGIPIDSVQGCYFLDTGESHNLIIGSTGCGKTRRLIIPYLFAIAASEENCVVHDPKGELYRLTKSRFEAAGYKVMALNGRRPSKSEGWNAFEYPYELIRSKDPEKKDEGMKILSQISKSISIPDQGNDRYWSLTAELAVYGALISMVKEAKTLNEATLKNALKIVNHILDDDPLGCGISFRTEHNSIEDMLLSPVTDNADNAKRNLISIMRSSMLPFMILESMTDMLSRNDIHFDAFLSQKTIVYIISPDESKEFEPIVTLFIKMLYKFLVSYADEHGGNLDRRMNIIIDEFASLPMIEDMPTILNASRSRNIRVTLAVQSLKQLEAVYGKEMESVKGNCNNIIYFTSRDLYTLKDVSELCGYNEGRTQYSVTKLQNLNKETGEILVLMDRTEPRICHLLDYSVYSIKNEL